MDTSLFGAPERFFNTAGPVDCDKHYCLPALERFDLNEVVSLIQKERYFILHAPRQTGKTTYLKALAHYLNKSGYYQCLYVNVEPGQAARGKVRDALQFILGEIAFEAMNNLQDTYLDSMWQQSLERRGAYGALSDMLIRWAHHTPKPIVLFMDEIDALIGDTLISVLRQLRSGYDKRPDGFPQSIILCGGARCAGLSHLLRRAASHGLRWQCLQYQS